MRLVVLCMMCALSYCQSVDLGKVPYTFEVPNDWTIQTSKNKKTNTVSYYCNSPNRMRYELTMVHLENVLLTVKNNATPFDGITSEAARKNRIETLVGAHKKRESARYSKQLGIHQYENEGVQHISFASSAPAYEGRMFHRVHHAITEKYTFLFFCSAIVDEEIENNQKLFEEIISSLKPV